MSTATTRLPRSAKHAPVTSPTYPTPMTLMSFTPPSTKAPPEPGGVEMIPCLPVPAVALGAQSEACPRPVLPSPRRTLRVVEGHNPPVTTFTCCADGHRLDLSKPVTIVR